MNRHDIAYLKSFSAYPSVSILLNTPRTQPEIKQVPTKLKNAIQEVRHRLAQEKGHHEEIQHILQRLDEVYHTISYTGLSEGLAIFVDSKHTLIYKVPFTIHEAVHIDYGFTVRDLAISIANQRQYWVLSLTAKPVRLFFGTDGHMHEILQAETNPMGTPQDSFPFPYLGPDESLYDSLETGMRDSTYLDNHKRAFFKQAGHLLDRAVGEDYRLPLFLVGDERNIAYFTQGYKGKLHIAGHISGEYQEAKPHEIYQRVKPVIDEYFVKQLEHKLATLREAFGNKHAAMGVRTIWRMAVEGRIHELIVEDGYAVAGKVNRDNPESILFYENDKTPGISDDVVAHIVELVYLRGGNVHRVPKGALDTYEHIAALLRY